MLQPYGLVVCTHVNKQKTKRFTLEPNNLHTKKQETEHKNKKKQKEGFDNKPSHLLSIPKKPLFASNFWHSQRKKVESGRLCQLAPTTCISKHATCTYVWHTTHVSISSLPFLPFPSTNLSFSFRTRTKTRQKQSTNIDFKNRLKTGDFDKQGGG